MKYVGEFKDGYRHGKGVMYEASGFVEYTGMWRHNRYHGHGTLSNVNAEDNYEFVPEDFNTLGDHWAKFEGEFADGLMMGEGTYTFVDGSFFTGKFKKDRVDGKGALVAPGGTIKKPKMTGVWKMDRLVK